MKQTLLIVVGISIIAAGVLEWKYFRFHTYFQSTEVQETLPPLSSGVPAADMPVTVATGTFGEVDAIHKGAGTARIVRQGGEQFLRLEDFSVTNGPDLFVYLVESETPGGSLESLGRYANLGPLKGNKGNQTYVISPAVPSTYRTAVVWCEEFSVLFSFAVMQ